MKITVIKVGMSQGKGYDALRPVLFEIIASLLPPDVKAQYLDDRKEDLPKHLDSDVIALSFDTFCAKRAYALAKRYKTNSNTIIMGGFHPSACPDEALEHCDAVLLGDAEGSWPEFLDDIKNGRLKKVYDARNKGCAMSVLCSNRHNLYKSQYLPLGLVQFSRGCKFRCDFCSIKTMYPGTVQQKPIDDIVLEITAAKERFLFFIDDNIFYDEKSAAELFFAIRPLKKKWVCQISLEIASNHRLLELMRKSGCICVLIGFESLDTKNLEAMGKSANLLINDYEKAIANLNSHRFMVYGTFVVGYDRDDENTAAQLCDFAIKQKLAVANFNPLIPFPSTNLYDRLKGENRLLHGDKWWLSEDFCYGDTAFVPHGMLPEQLKNSCKEARYRFYGAKNILARLPFHIKLGLRQAWYFLLVNIISGLEIRRKQGAKLGE